MVSYFGFDDMVVVLIVPVPGHYLVFTKIYYQRTLPSCVCNINKESLYETSTYSVVNIHV